MHRPNHNRRAVNLNKVQWCKLYWENQWGEKRSTFPRKWSVHGVDIAIADYAYPHPNYPCENNLERARRLDILDVWEPVCIVQLTANHQLHYVGEKAQSIWNTWKAKIYGNKNKV